MNNQDESQAYLNHDEIWLLLPWYANGSLQAEEHARVKAHVAVCLVCRKELGEQALLAKHLQHEPAVEISTKPSFDRLMARIQTEANPVAKPVQPRLQSTWLAAWLEGLRNAMNPWQLATACAGLLLALALPFLLLQNQQTSPDFHTVADSGSLDRFAATDLRVIFAQQATEQEMDALIRAIHGRIVDGPGPNGIFTIRLGDDGASESGISQALTTLQGHPAILFAQPALPRPVKPKDGDGS